MGVLSPTQLESWERDGVLVLPGFYSAADCSALQARAATLMASATEADAPVIFSSDDQGHARDEYFLTSGDTIRLFHEAADPSVVNKMGHAMHDLDGEFSAFSRTPALAGLAADLGFVDPKLLQSMYILKAPEVGGEVTWHTDHTFLWTDPASVVGFWVALDEATEENGCLWCLPGGHRAPVRSRFRRAPAGGTVMDVFDPDPYDATHARPLPAAVGTLVVLHGRLPHWSAPNTSSSPRHAYTLHVIEGQATYPADNWLQRPDMPLRGFEAS
ncbi:MAG: phytanoyl-CoA dioxygenase family protein [Actinomycetota bacterium]